MPALTPQTHVALTVSDLDRSVEWYRRVFDATLGADETQTPPTVGEMRFRSLFHGSPPSYLVGLTQHADGEGAPFDHRRVGLDHFGLHVAERADLDDWARHLDGLGIPHSGIQTSAYAETIGFHDPDGIALEIHWTVVEFWVALLTGGDRTG